MSWVQSNAQGARQAATDNTETVAQNPVPIPEGRLHRFKKIDSFNLVTEVVFIYRSELRRWTQYCKVIHITYWTALDHRSHDRAL